MRLLVASACTLLLAVGCGHAEQRPYQFRAATGVEPPIDTVARAFIVTGYQPTTVDPAKGLLHTQWEPLSDRTCEFKRYGDGRLMHRFTAIVAPTPDGVSVGLRMDTRCCPGSESLTDGVSIQRCEPFEKSSGDIQKEVNRVGALVQRAIVHSAYPAHAVQVMGE